MVLDKECKQALESRLNDELYASNHYYYASVWCSNIGLVGGKKYFEGESASEKQHAQKITDYMTGFNTMPKFMEIDVPQSFSSLKDILEKSLKLEEDLLEAYKTNYREFIKEGYEETAIFVQKFIKIQTESVIEYQDLLNQYNVYGENLLALFDKDVLGK